MTALYTLCSWFFLLFGGATNCPVSTHIDADVAPMPASCFYMTSQEDSSPPPFVLDTNISNGF